MRRIEAITGDNVLSYYASLENRMNTIASLLKAKDSEIEDKIEQGRMVEVRHGENITEMHPVDEFICSECGLIVRECCRYEIDQDDGDEICYEFVYKYCPRCGAKMGGERSANDNT